MQRVADGQAAQRLGYARAVQRFSDAQAALGGHPRHLLLAALVAGLLAGPSSAAALAAAVALALVAVRDGPLAIGALVALLAGAAVAETRLAALDRSALVPGALAARVTLLEHPRTRAFETRVAAAQLHGERVLVKAPARVRWPVAAGPGRIVAIEGRVAPLGPGDAHERRRGAHALLLAGAIRDTGARRGGLLGALDGVRDRSERALTHGAPAPQGALARGMVLGQDFALTDDVREQFRATGLAHLVAASGANVLLLAVLVLAFGAALGVGLSGRLWLAIALVAAYVPIAGAGPSIQRAAVMGIAGIVAALAGRPASRWYALLLAAAVTLIWNPRAAGDAGWQLSFAAVLAMIALVPGLRRRLTAAGLPAALAEALALTAAATLGTAPLIALHFERLSLVSLPANLLAAPAVAPVMWLGTIAGALGQVAPALAAPVTALAVLPLGYLTWLADAAAALPFAEVAVPSPGAAGVLGLYAGAAGATLVWRRLPRTGRRATAAVLAVASITGVAALAAGHGPGRPPTDLTVSFLDIGQGDATLIQHGDAAVLVDTGPRRGPLLARLRRAGVRRLDALVVTHDAADHDGETEALLAALPVGLVVDGEEATSGGDVRRLAAARGVRRIASDAGQVIRAGALQLRVLWPRRDPPAPADAEPNDRATVLHVRDGDFDLLLTADVESDVLSGLQLPVVEALKVSHHGSDDPGLPGLLARLRPQAAVIAVGRRNSYGHPAPATLSALAAAVPVVRRTDRDGTVRVTVEDGRMRVAVSDPLRAARAR
ncbi:MAG: ComEC/Rec2 family competence protein [Thermoleophilia bacterium]